MGTHLNPLYLCVTQLRVPSGHFGAGMIRLVFQCEAPLRANRRRVGHPSSRRGTFSAFASVRRPRGLRCLASLWSAPEDILQRRLASHGIPKLKQRNFLQNILESVEPFDTSQLKQDASPHAYDAMKRAISGMLGLLPSEQFQVTVQTPVEALSRVLVSAMYTGYTLKEAEYRMKMEQCMPLDSADQADAGDIGLPSERLADLEDDVRNYIRYIEQKLAAAEEQAPGGTPGSVAQEEPSRVATLASLGSEGPGNPLLDYLNVLDGDTAAHMSAPNSPEVDRAFHGVVNTLLGRLSRNDEQLLMDSHEAGHSAQGSNAQLVQEQTQPYETSVTASRDALARLLYWCMLMGHWTRYLEYKLQLESAFDGDAEGRQGPEAGAEAEEKEDSEGQGIFGMIGSLFGGADDDGNGGEREDEDESKAGGDDAGAKAQPVEGQGGGDAGARGIASERVTGAGDNDEHVL